MHRIRYFLEQSWLLLISAFAFGSLMAVSNAALSARIGQNLTGKLDRLMTELLPQAVFFEPVEADIGVPGAGGGRENVQIYKALAQDRRCVGWTFKASGQGFADKIEVVIAADTNFRTLAGFSVLACSETPGFGDRMKTPEFRAQFVGAQVGDLTLIKTGDPARIDDQIVAITGATITSEAVVRLFNTYLGTIKEQLIQKRLIGND